jgi:predicted RNA-binding Zn-ribbon protein involved in translation (DUF1610 family)
MFVPIATLQRRNQSRARHWLQCRPLPPGLLGLLLLAPWLGFAATAGGQEPDAKFAREYREPFKGTPANPGDFAFTGPDAEKCVQFEPAGLRITLPGGYPKERPATGLVSRRGVQGDFEITLTYEILQEPEPDDTSPQSRFTLGIALDKANPNQHRASLSHRWFGAVPELLAWMIVPRLESAKPREEGRAVPAKAQTGKLRLTRRGAELSFFAAQGAGEFQLLQKQTYGVEDLKYINIVAVTAGPKASLDVRVTELLIRTTSMPKTPDPKKSVEVEEVKLPEKNYAQSYFQSFKGKGAIPTGWDFIGPEADSCVHFEPAGLRMTLPTGWGGSRPPTGLKTLFGVKGDFELTMSFEILKEPNPADTGKGGTRLSLSALKDTPLKNTPNSEVATINRSTGEQGGVFVAWARLWDQKADKKVQPVKNVATVAKTGRLRLIRSGADLYYCTAEEAKEDFTFRAKFRFGAEDLLRVQIIGSTGGDKAALDVRVTDLRIRADAIPDMPAGELDATATPTATPVAPLAAPPPTTGGKGWLIAALIVVLVFLLLLALALGTWLYVRQRGKPKTTPPRPAANDPQGRPAPASFQCPACGKKLKVKTELAGTKVKCSQCGKAILVPAAEARQSGAK